MSLTDTERVRGYRERHPEKAKEMRLQYYSSHREQYRAYGRAPKRRFLNYIYYAEKHNREFTILYNEFLALTSSPCYYCGHLPTNVPNGIDRKDNNVGYVILNIVSCCWTCNKLKGTLHHNEFIERCKMVSEHAGKFGVSIMEPQNLSLGHKTN